MGVVCGLLPYVVALARAHVGYRHLAGVDNRKPSIPRQLLLTMAILTLLAFETIAIRIPLSDNAPLSAYAAAAVLYLVHFTLALFAFRPMRAAVG